MTSSLLTPLRCANPDDAGALRGWSLSPSVGREFGPVVGDRGVIVEQATIDQSVNDRGGQSFCRGRPWLRCLQSGDFTGAVGAAHPYIDDRRAVDVDAQGAATELARWVQSGERADHGAVKCGSAAPWTPDGRPSPGTRMSDEAMRLTMLRRAWRPGGNVDIRSL